MQIFFLKVSLVFLKKNDGDFFFFYAPAPAAECAVHNELKHRKKSILTGQLYAGFPKG